MLSQSPPPLPTQDNFPSQFLATKDQRIRAGLIDHFIDSSLWFWFFILIGWSVFHLEASVDSRSFLVLLSKNFPISLMIISLSLIVDFFLCVCRGQSIGQWINGIYKKNQPTNSDQILNRISAIPKIWLHSLISRCLGMPLLCISILIWLILNPTMTPIRLHDFSLIEPEGSLLLMIFLLKIIGWAMLLFGMFLPFGLGFIRSPLPTWYDRWLGVQTHASHF
jgi:hypothetical protein